MLLGVFEHLSLGGEVVLATSKTQRLGDSKKNNTPVAAGAWGMVHRALELGLPARSADRFERFTIKPPAVPEVSDAGPQNCAFFIRSRRLCS